MRNAYTFGTALAIASLGWASQASANDDPCAGVVDSPSEECLKRTNRTVASPTNEATGGSLVTNIRLNAETTSSEGSITFSTFRPNTNAFGSTTFSITAKAPLDKDTGRSQFLTEDGLPNKLGLTGSLVTSFIRRPDPPGPRQQEINAALLRLEEEYEDRCEASYAIDINDRLKALLRQQADINITATELAEITRKIKKLNETIPRVMDYLNRKPDTVYDASVIAEIETFCQIGTSIEAVDKEKLELHLGALFASNPELFEARPGDSIAAALKRMAESSEQIATEAFVEREAIFLSLTGTWGVEDFKFQDPLTFAKSEERKHSFSIAASLGLLPRLDSDFFFLAGGKYSEQFKASTTRIKCPAGTGVLDCVEGAFAPPIRNRDAAIFALTRWTRPDSPVGIELKLAYDFIDDAYGFELPIYLIRSAKDELTGGLRVAYTSDNGEDDDEWNFGVFVSKPFDFNGL